MSFPEQTLPPSIAPVSILPPSADLFARRAARLRQLATDAGDGLNLLAELADAQQGALAAVGDCGCRLPAGHDWQHPALASAEAVVQGGLKAIYDRLAGQLGARTGALPTFDEIVGRVPALRAHLAGAAVAGGEPADIVLAAALQVVWTAAAQHLDVPAANLPLAEGACPCCGSAPHGGIVLAGEGRAGLRYLECSLCGTRWNAVRARCTLCDDVGVVAYLGLAEAHPAVQAEVCDGCHGYVKTFFQDKDPRVEPLADDLATLALDVLVGEQGYGRGAPNAFLPAGDPA